MTRTAVALGWILSLAGAVACGRGEPGHADEHGASERGPHGGRWLEAGSFALELTLFEQGVPPEFRVFAFQDGEPVEPARVALEVTLRRLSGRVDVIGFTPQGDYLRGDRTVEEPHSFDVEILAREDGREHRFQFSSYENRMMLAPDQREAAGIAVAVAQGATIRETLVLTGRVTPNRDAHARVTTRFPGVLRSVHKSLGDAVARGDLLAVIESNESLRAFELRAPLAGTVIARDAAPGEFASSDRELFQIADLGSVWVDLDVHRRDVARLRVGQPLEIDAGDDAPPVAAKLAYLAPIGSETTQTLLARAVLPNPHGAWRPGLFATAEVLVGSSEVPVAVALEAVQRVRDWDVVFLAADDVFEAQPVELGRRDRTHVEIVSGLSAGQRYVAAGSFVLKAEAGKSGATHDH